MQSEGKTPKNREATFEFDVVLTVHLRYYVETHQKKIKKAT
jgi:hypothetical protein